jgi:disulfide bond formation protein DsbB
MRRLTLPTLALAGSVLAALALGIAHASERWEGLVPCALCLLQRWPYRAVIALGLVAAVVPRRIGLWLLWTMVIVLLGDAAIAAVHVGVEAHWWPSPLPECAAPRFTGGSIADRLAAMPARPAKPCDDPAYLIPGLPVSMAVMNLLFALAFAAALAFGARRAHR